jgi:hypothetical protein
MSSLNFHNYLDRNDHIPIFREENKAEGKVRLRVSQLVSGQGRFQILPGKRK